MSVRIAFAWICIAGCVPEVVQSALVETKDMSAHFTVHTAADGTSLGTARLYWVSGKADVLLGDGDHVFVDGVEMATESQFSNDYVADLASAADHLFSLQRPGKPPIEYRVTSPLPFALTSGPFSGTYDLEATLTWAPVRPGSSISIVARGDTAKCPTHTLATAHADTGSFSFTGADVRPTQSTTMVAPACTFTLEVTETTTNDGDASELSGAVLEQQHVESTTLTLN